MACERCEDLRAQVKALQAELGLRMRDGAMGALMDRFSLQPMPALLLVALYHAKGRACSLDYLTTFIGSTSVENVKVYVWKARQALGANAIENINSHGYRLTAAGAEKVLEAVGT